MIDLGKILGYASALNDRLTDIETATSALLHDETPISPAPDNKASHIFEDALESDFNSQRELEAKKVLATAIAIAKQKKVLPESIPADIDPVSTASLADESLLRAKVAAKVAQGEMAIYEGADRLIDQATARLIAVSDHLVEKGVDMALNKGGAVIARVFPPASPIVAVVKSFQPYITQKAQQFVRTGIKKLNVFAKYIVRKVGTKIKNRLSNIVSRLFS